MNIDEMSEQEKSVVLAKLCGWLYTEMRQTAPEKTEREYIIWNGPETKEPWGILNLSDRVWLDMTKNMYNPANMALAWKVLNWASSKSDIEIDNYSFPYTLDQATEIIFEGEYDGNDIPLWKMPPAEAQRLWLDKILELAIEAGMVTND